MQTTLGDTALAAPLSFPLAIPPPELLRTGRSTHDLVLGSLSSPGSALEGV